jgi:hypothetical protein
LGRQPAGPGAHLLELQRRHLPRAGALNEETAVGRRGQIEGVVLAALLWLGAWLAAMLLSTPRTAFVVALVMMALVDIAALPPRGAPDYDDRRALYRTDQAVAAHLEVPADISDPVLSVLVEPVFAGAQPAFGLAGEVNGTPLAWSCGFARGMQHVALPISTAALDGRPIADVNLHLTGAPSRETDYLLVYSSAERGVLMSIEGRPSAGNAIICDMV